MAGNSKNASARGRKKVRKVVTEGMPSVTTLRTFLRPRAEAFLELPAMVYLLTS